MQLLMLRKRAVTKMKEGGVERMRKDELLKEEEEKGSRSQQLEDMEVDRI